MKTRKFIFAFLIYFCVFGIIFWIAASIFFTPLKDEKKHEFLPEPVYISEQQTPLTKDEPREFFPKTSDFPVQKIPETNNKQQTPSYLSWSFDQPLNDKTRIDPEIKEKWLSLQWKSSVEDKELPDTYDELSRAKVAAYPFDTWKFEEPINSEKDSDYKKYFAVAEEKEFVYQNKKPTNDEANDNEEISEELDLDDSKIFFTRFIVNQPNQKQPVETVTELKKIFEVMFPKELPYEIALVIIFDENNRILEFIHLANGDDGSVKYHYPFYNYWLSENSKYKGQLLKIVKIHNHPDPEQVEWERLEIGASFYSETDLKSTINNIKNHNLRNKNLNSWEKNTEDSFKLERKKLTELAKEVRQKLIELKEEARQKLAELAKLTKFEEIARKKMIELEEITKKQSVRLEEAIRNKFAELEKQSPKKTYNRFIFVNHLVYAESDKGLAGPKNDLTQPLTEKIVCEWYSIMKSNEIYNDTSEPFELIQISDSIIDLPDSIIDLPDSIIDLPDSIIDLPDSTID